MRKILACTLLLSILLGYATATAQSRKERRAKRKAKTEKQASKSTHTPVSVKPEKTVTEKTTVQQTEPYCPELNRNLTPAQIDSLVALWREKQTLQSYDTFFNDYIDIDSLASSSDTTPDSSLCQPPAGTRITGATPLQSDRQKTTSAVTSIPVTGQSTGC